MNKETAKDLSITLATLKDKIATSESFRLIDKDDSEVVDGFHDFANTKKSLGRFLITNNEQTLWFLVIDWKNNNNFYLVLYPENSNFAPLAELHREIASDEGSDLKWKYSPRKKDGKNENRKSIFQKMYGTLETIVSLPNKLVTLDDFLEDVFHLVKCRELADGLDENHPSITPKSFPEGKRIERKHYARERSSQLVNKAKKQYAKKNNGNMPCEVCEFEFKLFYGNKGAGYIEAHHKTPLHELDSKGNTPTQIKDLAMVCANCHRMLHRTPIQTIEELKLSLNAL